MKPDDARIEKIINSYGDLLYRTGMMILGNPQEVQDVLQEVLLKVWQKNPDFRDSGHERAWLLRVTINLCKDMLRFRFRHQYLQIDELEVEAAAPDGRQLIQEILQLPVKWRMALMLHYVEGYSLKEIADILAISENAVKKRLQRAKEGLRKKLQDESSYP